MRVRDVSDDEAIDVDEQMMSKFDKPLRYGLQALGTKKRTKLLDYLDSEFEPAKSVNFRMTSEAIAKHATWHFKKQGERIRVSNLMVKSAMKLLGHEPTVRNADILHYRIRSRDKHDKEGSL